MDLMKIFNFEKKEIRVAIKNNEPFFCLKDVCDVLELSQISRVKDRLEEDGVILSNLTDSLGRVQDYNFINEPNLYRVIFKSRKEDAKKFQDWIFNDVIPSIRKTGSYNVSNSITTMQDVFASIKMLSDTVNQGMKNQNDRINKIDDRLTNIENKFQERKTLLPAPQKSDRDNLNQIVRKYAFKNDMNYMDVWNSLYRESNYRLKTNLYQKANNQGISVIDYIVESGHISEVLAIALEMFQE